MTAVLIADLFVDVIPQLDAGRLQSTMRNAARSAGPIKLAVDLDTRLAERALRDLQRRGGSVTMRVNADTSAAQSSISALRGSDINVGVDLAMGGAEARIAALESQIRGLERRVDVDVRVDDNGSIMRVVNDMSLLTAAAFALGPALIPLGAVAVGGLAALGPALLAGAGAAGVAGLAFSGVGDALKALGEQEKEAAAATMASAKQQQAAARQVESAQTALANARRSAADGAANAAARIESAQEAVADAEQRAVRVAQDGAARVAKARQQVARAEQAAARSAEDAAERVADARRRAQDAEADAARAAEGAAERVIDARSRLADAEEDAARSAEQSSQRVADARRSLIDAERDAARAAEDAAERVEDARDQMADATEQAAETIERALRRQADAEEDLADAQRDVTRVQERLTEAREKAQKKLEDYSLDLRKGAIRERDATLDVQAAYAKLQNTLSDPAATEFEKERAKINYDEQVASLEELRVNNRRLAEDAAEAAAKGVEGSDEVTTANERVADAQERVVDAERAAADAAAAVQKARVDGAKAIADAEESVSDALRDQSESAEDNARRVADAQRNIAEAVQSQAQTQKDAAERVQDAQKGVSDAMRDQSRVAEENARRIADAQEAIRDAVRDQAQAQADGAQQVRDAQAGVAEAVQANARAQADAADNIQDAEKRVGDARRAAAQQAASSAAAVAAASKGVENALADQAAVSEEAATALTKVDEEMAKLGPTGQEFVRFLHGLRPLLKELKVAAEDGLLPGIMDGITAALPAFPNLLNMVSALAGALGDVARASGEWLGSKEGRDFLDFISKTGPPLIAGIAAIIGNLAQGFIALAKAFSPVTQDIVDGLEDLSQRFEEFGEGGGFEPFVDYIQDKGPLIVDVLGRVFEALGNLLIAAEPIGIVAVHAIGLLADVINALPKDVLTGLIAAFITMSAVVTAINGAFRLYTLALTAHTVATGAFTAAVWLKDAAVKAAAVSMRVLNAVMKANPIGLVITALTLLVAGFVLAYKNSETFRKIVDAAWAGIKNAAEASWNFIRDKVFAPLGTFLTVTLPANWESFRKGVSDKWAAVQKFVGDGWAWVRDHVFKPIGTFVTATIPGGFESLRSQVSTKWKAFEGIIGGGWTWVRDKVFNPLGTFVKDTIPGYFTTAIGAIERIWGKLSEKVSGPIGTMKKFVNDNLIDPLNKVTTLFGLTIPKLATGGPVAYVGAANSSNPQGIPRRAEGGLLRGPGTGTSDSILGLDKRGVPTARVSNGEFVVREKSVKKYGLTLLNALNTGQYADGGVVGMAKKAGVKGYFLGGLIDKAMSQVQDWLSKGAKFAVGKVLDPAVALISAAVPSPKFANDIAKGIPTVLKDKIGSWADKKEKESVDLSGGSFNSGIRGGVAFTRSVKAAVAAAFPSTRGGGDLSLNRAGDSDHNKGKALDIFPGTRLGQYANASQIAEGNRILRFLSQPRFNTDNLIWQKRIINARGNRSYDRYGPNPGATLGHYDHVHWDTFDNGGWLKRGATLAQNSSGVPEAILTGPQWAEMSRLIAAVEAQQQGKGGPVAVIEKMYVDNPADAQRVAQTLEFYARAGRIR